MKRYFWLSLVVLLLLSACAPATTFGNLTIENPRIRATLLAYSEVMSEHAKHMPVDQNAPFYLQIQNSSDTSDYLIAADSPLSEQMVLWDGENPLYEFNLELPAQTTTRLEIGDYHLLLINLQKDLTPDMTIPVTLVFANAGEITLEVPAKVIQVLN